MEQVLRFQEWLDDTCRDAERKLGLSKQEIAYQLTEKAKRLQLEVLIGKGEKWKG